MDYTTEVLIIIGVVVAISVVLNILIPPKTKGTLFENLWDECPHLDTYIAPANDNGWTQEDADRIDYLMQLHYERLERERQSGMLS